jgi:hypothetical protein
MREAALCSLVVWLETGANILPSFGKSCSGIITKKWMVTERFFEKF